MSQEQTTYVPLVKVYAVKEKMLPYGKEKLNTPEKIAAFARDFLGNVDREYLLVLSLDMERKPVGLEVVAIGSLNQAIVEVREVFKHAILSNASDIVVIHNHPSGNIKPSREDKSVTQRLCEAGKLLGIIVQDHIIIGDGEDFYSFADEHEDTLSLVNYY
ncbi:JAB domain-containing protein [Faecalicatena contorta]|uniref:JAB domain-containing protein n=1 Tax=Faecalicatena contorta TaxID=39482 RepID=UPI001F476325|nr:JAB domain-containing protein [Faecalicatena contorta]MCF2554382.1 JAB domain-containing protein [Faecalicatena contorta]